MEHFAEGDSFDNASCSSDNMYVSDGEVRASSEGDVEMASWKPEPLSARPDTRGFFGRFLDNLAAFMS